MTPETHAPRFSGLFIPVRLLRAPGMNILDKALLTMIEVLSRRKAGCTATNAYLAHAFGVHETTITKTVARLEERGLAACSYAEDSHRTIRMTRAGSLLWMPDIEAGDDPDGGVGETPRGVGETPTSCKSKSDIEEESIRAHEAAAADLSGSLAGNAKTEYLAHACEDEEAAHTRSTTAAAAAASDGYESLLPELKAMGNTDFQAYDIIGTARSHGRPVEWLQGWMAEANRKADRPGAFLQRMVSANADLPEPSKPKHSRSDEVGDPYNRPVSPERQAAIEAHHDAEYQRTRRTIIDGQEGVRPTDADLEASGWHSVKEALKSRIEAEAPAAHWGARPYQRPTDEEREKIRESKAELEERARQRQEGLYNDQETTSGSSVEHPDIGQAAAPELPL